MGQTGKVKRKARNTLNDVWAADGSVYAIL